MTRKMTRCTFLMGVGGAAALASFGSLATGQIAKRNVLWIIDDDHPQYMMDPLPITRRNIRDAGLNFGSGSADVPLCGPARVGILTGLSAQSHNCGTNGTWPKFEGSPRKLGERTVARYMKDAGYATGHFGKYINAHAKAMSVASFWDRWCETLGDGLDAGKNRQIPNKANVDGDIIDIDWIPSGWAAQRCAEFVRNRKGSPWFAQYCPTIPHFPYNPTYGSRHLYDGARRRVRSVNEKDVSDKPKWMRKLPRTKLSAAQEEFEGKKEELADLDRHGVRPILEALASTGQLANTVIFFTSDNGYLFGEHRLRKKDEPYWESSEVPFFVKGPGVRRGSRIGLVSHLDLMPTTCEMAGILFSALDVDGRSMLANLGRDAFFGWRKRMLISGSQDVGPEMNPGGANNPSGRWWLLREGSVAFIQHENGAKELYWMKSDPHQVRSKRKAAKRSLINRLTDTLRALRASTGEERRRLEER
jgi:N-acetylglucosamine-6-sulfatase